MKLRGKRARGLSASVGAAVVIVIIIIVAAAIYLATFQGAVPTTTTTTSSSAVLSSTISSSTASTSSTTSTSTSGTSTTTSSAAVGLKYVANLSASKEVPKPTNVTGTAVATFTISPDNSTITYVLTVTNMVNVTAAHIHLGNSSTAGPVIVPLFTGPAKSGPFSGILAQGNITQSNIATNGSPNVQTMAQLIAAIKSGQTYANVHTTAFPAGAIRGQIVPST